MPRVSQATKIERGCSFSHNVTSMFVQPRMALIGRPSADLSDLGIEW